MSQLTEILIAGAAELGITLPDGAADTFNEYCEYLTDRGRVHNLTAITGAGEIARLHFLDSIALLSFLELRQRSIIDVGSGAGFPGIPLRIAEPTIRLTLLDATVKRVTFQTELCERLGLLDVTCLHGRAEEAAHDWEKRESFDAVLSRAVARLNVLCELCIPFIKPGGQFIAMKGTDSDDELNEAAGSAAILGAEIDKAYDYRIPGTDITHRAIVIKKVAVTPAGYPRRYSKIQKTPL